MFTTLHQEPGGDVNHDDAFIVGALLGEAYVVIIVPMMSKPHGMLYCTPLIDVYRREKRVSNNWQAVSDTPSDEFGEIEYELMMNMLLMWRFRLHMAAS